MKSWSDGLQSAIEYIEEHLTEEMNIRDISACAYVSEFHFQRIFSVLCGITVGEYIRCRRLSLAAQELTRGAKVIDTALKYGYDSPDSFARAFARFHGVAPSAAKGENVSLRSFAPLRISLSLEGGTMLEYRITHKASFTVVGKAKRFSGETSYQEIPVFWQEFMGSEDSRHICGTFGICLDGDGKSFEYLIADNYSPWKDIPEGFVTRFIPEGTWAVFPCRGALPEALQSVNTAIWKEWLPNLKGYRLGGNYNLEFYTPAAEKPEDNYSEIWVPIEEIK